MVWSQAFSTTRSTKSMENTCLQVYCHHLECSSTLLQSLLAINTSQEPGRHRAYLSKIPAQCALQADTCKNNFRNPHSLGTKYFDILIFYSLQQHHWPKSLGGRYTRALRCLMLLWSAKLSKLGSSKLLQTMLYNHCSLKRKVLKRSWKRP